MKGISFHYKVGEIQNFGLHKALQKSYNISLDSKILTCGFRDGFSTIPE